MSEGSFEAKLTAKRETAAGIYLTVQVQPDDYKTDLATLRVGALLMVGWAEVVNTDVEPVSEPMGNPARSGPYPASDALSTVAGVTAGKDRRPFSSLPLSQQAALKCQDSDFKLFLSASNADGAAVRVREICQIESRSELDVISNMTAREYWFGILDNFDRWLTDQRYAEAKHG